MLLLLLAGWVALPASGRDLQAASDGEHLWLVVDDPDAEADGPGRLVYHTSTQASVGALAELDRIDGELMPRGLAAGDGRLLMVRGDGVLEEVRPVWSELLKRYTFDRRTLPALPGGCSLLSVSLGARGPWALVRVEDAALLGDLEPVGEGAGEVLDRVLLNRALGLPDDYEWDPPGSVPGESEASGDGGGASGAERSGEAEDANAGGEDAGTDERGGEAEADDADGGRVDGGGVAEDETASESDADEDEADAEAADAASDGDEAEAAGTDASRGSLRLIRLFGGRWVSSPLPESMPRAKQAVLLMSDDDARPTLLIETEPGREGAEESDASGTDSERETGSAERAGERADQPSQLIRFSPIGPGDEGEAEAPRWARNTIRPRPGPGRLWSAAMVNGQAVLAVEYQRLADQVRLDAYLLRGGDAIRFGELALLTRDDARWAAVPWRDGLGAVASPAMALTDEQLAAYVNEPIAGMTAIDLDGQPINTTGPDTPFFLLYQPERSPHAENADLYIQIATFVIAMSLLMIIWAGGKLPRPEQLDLPDHLVLASFARRFIGGMIDLVPGFFVAGLVYNTDVNETLMYWPGNGIPKVLHAMRPGMLVILVTVGHTTVFEFITARSIGKWVTGTYVAELNGKPAPPGACLVRALSRVFDLFAPLIIIIMLISPARQRLGDILAETTVVMRKPEPFDPEDEQ